MPISVLIVDDHPLIREGLSKILGLSEEINVVGEAQNGREAVMMTVELHPQVVLLDINMPVMNGIEAARVIKKELPNTGIIALTIHDDEEYIIEMINSGVSGYVMKDIQPEQLIKAINEVSYGKKVIPPEIEKRIGMRDLECDQPRKKKASNELTNREYDVLMLIAQGMSNRDISQTLFISEKTVKNHITNIFKKIDVYDRTQAAIYAIKKGIVKI